MAKVDKGTASLLASLEERGAQIRELERETDAQAQEIERLNRLMAEQTNRHTFTLENARRDTASYRELYEKTTAQLAQVQGIIATMDTKAIERVRLDHKNEIARRDQQIDRLKEDVHRALGWIASKYDQHPMLWSVRPNDREPFNRVVTKPPERDQDEEIPF